jgi:hypothetical protein
LITCWVLERRIRVVVAADGAMAVLVAVVSPGTREKEFGGRELTLMSAATLAVGSMTTMVIEEWE